MLARACTRPATPCRSGSRASATTKFWVCSLHQRAGGTTCRTPQTSPTARTRDRPASSWTAETRERACSRTTRRDDQRRRGPHTSAQSRHRDICGLQARGKTESKVDVRPLVLAMSGREPTTAAALIRSSTRAAATRHSRRSRRSRWLNIGRSYWQQLQPSIQPRSPASRDAPSRSPEPARSQGLRRLGLDAYGAVLANITP